MIESRKPAPLADARRSLLLAAGLSILGAALHVWLVPEEMRERSDLPHYWDSAVRWAIDGAAPYRDFPFEYPPAALLLLRGPVMLVAAEICRFQTALTALLSLFDAVALFAAFLLVFDARQSGSQRRGLQALGFAWILLLLCGSLLFTRFDIAPSALMALGVALIEFTPGWAGAALGAATALKLYPFWAVPALAVKLRRDEHGKISGIAKVVMATISGVAAALVITLPAALPAGTAALSFLGYHGARGVQFQSLWGALWMVLAQRGWVRLEIVHAFGAEEISGAPRLLVWLATVLPILWMLLCARAAPRLPHRVAALAAICGFVALGKVGSPQFSIALAPLAAGCLFDAPLATAAILASFLLQAWQFPSHYGALVANQGIWAAVGLARMLLVLFAGALLLRSRSDARRAHVH